MIQSFRNKETIRGKQGITTSEKGKTAKQHKGPLAPISQKLLAQQQPIPESRKHRELWEGLSCGCGEEGRKHGQQLCWGPGLRTPTQP